MAGGSNPFVVEVFVLLAVAWTVILLRTYARFVAVGFKHFQLDDYMMLAAGVAYALETGAAYIVGAWWNGLANNGMSDEERASLDPTSEEYRLRVGGSKTQLVGWSLYTLILWSLKLCMCVFYARLTNGISNMRIRIRLGYAFIGVTYVATILSILFACNPMQRNWQINPDPGNTCQPAISRVNLLVTVVLNILTDLYLICIPIPLLWAAQMTWRKKGLLVIIFGGGFFVMACGILRCALILLDPVHGAQQAGSWAVRETFAAVVIDNIPMIYPLCAKVVRRVEEGIGSYYGGQSKLSSGSDGNNSYALPSRSEKKTKFVHPLSLRNITAGDSAESIVRDESMFSDQSAAKRERVKNGQNILIVKESTVNISPKDSDDQIYHSSASPPADTGYTASCNPSRGVSLRDPRPNRQDKRESRVGWT